MFVGEEMLAAQSDLFGGPCLAGLRLGQAFVTVDEEKDLLARISGVPLSPFQYQGWRAKRLTASFGWRYDFDTGRLLPAEPLPGWLLPLRKRAAKFAGLVPADLVQGLLIRYDPGAGIGWHKDRPVFSHVIGISLGTHATMRFRRRREGGFDRASAELPPRSIYHFNGEARDQWEHSIAEMPEIRWSITFRSLA